MEKLTIRRAKLDQRGFDSLEKPEATALRELHLIGCDINDDALCDILLHPEALKEFSMTQLPIPNPPLEESSDDIGDYIIALKSAQHSLESITIDFASLDSENALRMREFEQIKSLQIRDYQLFGQSTPRLNSVGLPPNLEVLEFFSRFGQDEDVNELLSNTIEQKEYLARHWRQMIVPDNEEGLPANIVEACRPFGTFLCVVGSD